MAEHFSANIPELDIDLETGMRLTEEFQLRWASLDFKRKEMRLRTTENHSRRSIPMNAEVLEAFQQLKPAIVFPFLNEDAVIPKW
jgi:integrase